MQEAHAPLPQVVPLTWVATTARTTIRMTVNGVVVSELPRRLVAVNNLGFAHLYDYSRPGRPHLVDRIAGVTTTMSEAEPNQLHRAEGTNAAAQRVAWEVVTTPQRAAAPARKGCVPCGSAR